MRPSVSLPLLLLLALPAALALADDPPAGFPPPTPQAGEGPVVEAARVVAPRLIGLDMAEAQQAIARLGLTARPWFVDAPSARAWTVVNQKIGEGTSVAAGTIVDFRVAKPRVRTGQVPVPSLLGLGREDALTVLRGLGVEGVMLSRRQGDFTGTVVRQDPEPVGSMPWDQYLTFTLSGGDGTDPVPAPVTAGAPVPSVVGLSQAEAEARLRRARFAAHVVLRVDPDAEPGFVVEQSPAAGAPVASGSAVTIVLPRTAQVPDVRGLSHEEAGIAISGAGLETRFDERPLGSEAAPVMAQRPPSGRTVAAGSPVTLIFQGDPPEGGPVWQAQERPFGAVPDVLGVAPEIASTRLGSAGFVPAFEGLDALAPASIAVVAGQSHAPGARVRQGVTVRLAVESTTAGPIGEVKKEEGETLLGKVGGFFRRIPKHMENLGASVRHGVEKIPDKVGEIVK
jgi:beta-lactam-binding protein with PASTA domain